MTKLEIYNEIKSILLETSTENKKWFDAFIKKHGNEDGLFEVQNADTMKLGVVEARLEYLAMSIYADVQQEVVGTR